MKFKITLLILSICLSSYAQSLPAGFETVAYEGFVYTNGQDLIDVGGGTGWTSNWQQFYFRQHISARTNSYVYEGLTTTGGKATYDNTCYGYTNGDWCNGISSSGRKLTPTTQGVLYLQFLADLGSQAGGGTPHVRLDFNGSTTVVLGKEGDGDNWVLYDSNTGTSASTNISGNSTVRLVIVRFDYTNNTMRMYIDPNLSTFDYSNPSGHNAEISGISIPYFDEIGPMFRVNGTPGIDEIHVFKESSETFTNSSGDGQWDTPSNWASGSVPSSSTNITISSGQSIEAGNNNSGTASATANENQTLSITAPSGLAFTSVDFASYGTPTSPGGDFVIGSCHATNSQSIVESYLIGNTGTVSIPATNGVFGDPCSGIVKRLYVKATYGNSTAAVANNLTIESGGSLTIAKNSDLTLSGDFTNNGTVTLNSESDEFSSIIVGGSSTGNIVYNRYVNTVGSGEWDLIGSPVDGLSISDFVTTNSSVLATNGSTYAVGYHDNTDDSWTNYTTSTVGGAGNFDASRGYQMATSSGATMAFTGSIATTDQTQSIINNNGNGNGGRRWNLVANPFPSYLNANTNAHASNNFLSVNASVIDSNFLSIYGWDADGSGYTIYNNSSSATYIAPGQAFFVAAASSSAANLSFTEAMQTTTGGDDFISLGLANTSSEFSLYLHEGQDKVATTRFYFDYGLGLGLDPGYDAGAYNSSMALSSRLAEDDQGINMGINAMNIDSFEQTTIPLVINKEAGTTFRISMEDSTIPENVDVLLLDTQTQISTNLRDQDFILSPQSDLSGMGRFYLKMGSNSLGGNDIEESYISIYKPSDRDCIVMEGLSNVQSGHVTLYNIMGQEVIDQNLTPNQSTQNILTSGIQSGIYIIKLKADNLILTKKLIIK